MTGNELRVLRAVWRGAIYEGALGLMTTVEQRKALAAARALTRRGYLIRSGQAFRITDAGREIVEAMTP